MNKKDRNKFKKMIIAMKRRFQGEFEKLDEKMKILLKENACAISNHPADRAPVTVSIHQNRIANLRKLIGKCDQAIKRLEDGTFGICVECRNPIPHGRLEIAPHADKCVECKNEIETHNKMTGAMPVFIPAQVI